MSVLFLPVCTTRVDLGFLIDSSGSIIFDDPNNFEKCKDFVIELTKAFTIYGYKSRSDAVFLGELS